MSAQTPTAALGELETALESGDFDAIDDALDALADAYSARRDKERLEVRQAIIARDTTELTQGAQSALDDFIKRYDASKLTRVAVLSTGDLYLLEPTEELRSEYSGAISELRTSEQQLTDSQGQAMDIVSGVSLPPQLGLASVDAPDEVLKGNPLTISTTLRNVGNSAAPTVRVTQSSGLGLTPQVSDIGELAPDATAETSFDGTATEAGEFTVELTATSDAGNPLTRDITISVLSKADITGNAVETIEQLQSQIVDSDAIVSGQEQKLVSKLDAALNSIDRAQAFIEEGRPKQADNQLKTASQQLGAFLNAFEAFTNGQGNNSGKGKSLSDRFIQTITRRAELAVDQLARAQNAEI